MPHPGQPESLNGPHSDPEKTKCKICGAFILKVLFLFHVGTSTSEVMGNDFFCCGVTNIAIFLLYLATFPTPLSNFFSIIETSKNSPNSSRNVRNIFISYTVEGKGPNFGLHDSATLPSCSY